MLVAKLVIHNLDNDKFYSQYRGDEKWVRDINDATTFDSEAEIQKEFAQAEEDGYGKLSPEWTDIYFSFDKIYILQSEKAD